MKGNHTVPFSIELDFLSEINDYSFIFNVADKMKLSILIHNNLVKKKVVRNN